MRYTSTSHHISIEEDIVALFEKKLDKLPHLLHKNEEADAHIEVTHDTKHHHKGEIYKVALTLHTPGKKYFADSNGASVRKAFEGAYSSLQAELRKHNKKQTTIFKKGAQTIKQLFKR